MPSHVLSLSWPTGVKPLNLPDFETQARCLRYRALGNACKDLGVKALLLAHHADDQAETILMRLAIGHGRAALQGMREIANIPECWGMYGISESGCHENVLETRDPPKVCDDDHYKVTCQRDDGKSPSSAFEGGGIKVMRPLLGFTKQALIETCRAKKVDWVEDETNQDAWRTPRNAIRNVFTRSDLPRALSRQSLLDLALRAQERGRRHMEQADKFASRSQLLKFDLRSGSLTVRFVRSVSCSPQSFDQKITCDERRVTSLLAKKFIKLVTPLEEIPLSSLQLAVNNIFPEDFFSGGVSNCEGSKYKSFTAAGVQFQRIKLPLDHLSVQGKIRQEGLDTEQYSEFLDSEHVWIMTRQPCGLSRMSNNISTSGRAPMAVTIPGRPFTQGSALQSPQWVPWHLWDGRYWIKILNHLTHPLEVRSLRISDMQAIRSKFPSRQVKDLEKALSEAAPGKVRWTLPIIAEAIELEGEGVQGRVLAIPTLGSQGVIDARGEDGKPKVEWEIRYKKVDLEVWKGAGRAVVSWHDV